MAKRKSTVKNKAGGYIGLFRSLLNWEYAEDDAIFSCFVKLLLAVNYKDNKWCGEVIKRGSIIGSIDTLCIILHMKKDKLRRCLNALSECGAITVMVKPNTYHLIVVNNYNIYQNLVIGISDNITANKTDNNPDDKTDNNPANKTDNRTDNNPDTTKEYIYKKDKKVSVAPTGQTDTVKKEILPTAVSPLGEPPAATENKFDYSAIDWSKIRIPPDDERDKTFGYMPVRPVREFAEAQNIDDYTAGEFHTAFEKSETPFPKNWEEIFLRYANADDERRSEFCKRLISGEYREKWME